MAGEKKGITVKIDADLHAEVRQYLEQHGMTMAEFVTLALDDELHPKHEQKEEQKMGNMRTLAFQVPEELFQKIKGYLARNNMTQKEFVIGLIETELEREQTERESMTQTEAETQAQGDPALGDDSHQLTAEDTPEFGEELQEAENPEESQDMDTADYIEESEDESMAEVQADISDDAHNMEAGEAPDESEAEDEEMVFEDIPEESEEETMSETPAETLDEVQSEEIGDFTDEGDMDYEDEEETEYQGFSMGM